MATNKHLVTAQRPDLPVFGSLYLQDLWKPAKPGSPQHLATTLAYAEVFFGTTVANRLLPDWLQQSRTRKDAVRGINQTDVEDLDAASFQELTFTPQERGLPQPVDYRQAQVAHGTGPLVAEQLATKSSTSYLVDTIELVSFGGGTVTTSAVGSGADAPAGLNVSTALGSGEEQEVVGPSTLPFNAAGTVDLDDPDADAIGLIKSMIEAYEDRHNVTPDFAWISNRVKHALMRNNSFTSLVDREFTVGDLLAELARHGLERVRIARNNRGICSDVMMFAKVEGPEGGSALETYNPITVGATNKIDSLDEDYLMGGLDVPGSPLLAKLIGYMTAKAKWGSIKSVRAACNFDPHRDYRGLVRGVNLFAQR